jgi:hypothetical protein
MCRPCHSAYHREHYLAHKQRYVDQARRRKQALMRERTAYLLDYFASHPCADCGERDARLCARTATAGVPQHGGDPFARC